MATNPTLANVFPSRLCLMHLVHAQHMPSKCTGTWSGRKTRRKKSPKWEKEPGQGREGRSRAWLRYMRQKHHTALIRREDELVTFSDFTLFSFLSWKQTLLHAILYSSDLIYRHSAPCTSLLLRQRLSFSPPLGSGSPSQPLLLVLVPPPAEGAELWSHLSWRHCHHHALLYTYTLLWFPKCLFKKSTVSFQNTSSSYHQSPQFQHILSPWKTSSTINCLSSVCI